MNELRNRVRKLEEIAKEKKGGKRIILWKGPGDTEQSLLKGYSEEERSRAIIFQWTVEGVDVPMPEEVDEDFLNRPMSPELKEKVQEVINDGQINSPQRPREALEGPKISSEGLDREISRVIQELKAEGMSQREIEKVIQEEEGGKPVISDLVALTGGRGRKKRFSINEGE